MARGKNSNIANVFRPWYKKRMKRPVKRGETYGDIEGFSASGLALGTDGLPLVEADSNAQLPKLHPRVEAGLANAHQTDLVSETPPRTTPSRRKPSLPPPDSDLQTAVRFADSPVPLFGDITINMSFASDEDTPKKSPPPKPLSQSKARVSDHKHRDSMSDLNFEGDNRNTNDNISDNIDNGIDNSNGSTAPLQPHSKTMMLLPVRLDSHVHPSVGADDMV